MADQQSISHEVTTLKMMASLDSYIHQQHHHHHHHHHLSLLEMSEVANFELGDCLTNYKPWVFEGFENLWKHPLISHEGLENSG
jgi:hypothetical protein